MNKATEKRCIYCNRLCLNKYVALTYASLSFCSHYHMELYFTAKGRKEFAKDILFEDIQDDNEALQNSEQVIIKIQNRCEKELK